MAEPAPSPQFFAVFGLAWILGLSQFAVLAVLARRLGMSWKRSGLSWSLGSGDFWRLVKMMWGAETPPADAGVGGLLWAWRGLQVAFVAAVAVSMLMMTGAV
jgi:hypothetical protein